MKRTENENDNLEEFILGYCLYCKDEIFERHDYVVRGADYYHVDCFNDLTNLDDDDDNDSDTE